MAATALVQKATALFLMGRYAEAQDALEQTLPIFHRSGHRYRVAINLGNLASIAMMRGHLASSERYAREALELGRRARGDGSGGELPPRPRHGGDVQLALRARRALACCEAIRVAHELEATPAEAEGYYRLATLERRRATSTRPRGGRRSMELSADGALRPRPRLRRSSPSGTPRSRPHCGRRRERALTSAVGLFDHLDLPPSVREATVVLAAANAGSGEARGWLFADLAGAGTPDARGLLGHPRAGPDAAAVPSHPAPPPATPERTRCASRRGCICARWLRRPVILRCAAGFLAVPAHALLLS